jgi:DNA-binding MarR family transcriptional regulator
MKKIDNEIEKIQATKKNDPDINLYILLDQTNSIVSNAVEQELKHLRMTQPQVRVLTMLSRRNRPVTLEELADWTLKEFNSVFTLINRMEKKGLIKKIKKEDDLKTYIVLTPKGSDLYHKQVTELSLHYIFEKLNQKEKENLYMLLAKVRDTTCGLLGRAYKPPFLP